MSFVVILHDNAPGVIYTEKGNLEVWTPIAAQLALGLEDKT